MSNDGNLLVSIVGCLALAALLKLATLHRVEWWLRLLAAALIVGSALGILCALWELGVGR